MSVKTNNDLSNTAITLQFLARYGVTGNNTCHLTNAQWDALRFFNQANSFSRTLSGFATFRSTTHGSASQTIKSLLKKRLLTRKQDPIDRRRAYFELTDEARDICKKDPLDELIRVISSLSTDQQGCLEAILRDMSAFVSESQERRVLGSCQDCQFRKEHFHTIEDATGGFCVRVRADLSESDIGCVCIHYSPKRSDPGKTC